MDSIVYRTSEKTPRSAFLTLATVWHMRLTPGLWKLPNRLLPYHRHCFTQWCQRRR
jgi:hypothetical protein